MIRIKYALVVIFMFFINAVANAQQLPNENLVPYRVGELWGYSDVAGNVIIQPEYERAYFFYEGLAFVQKSWKESYFINKENKIVFKVPDTLSIEDNFNNGRVLCRSRKTYKYGFLDRRGELVIPTQYERAEPFENNVAVVRYEWKKIGLIDTLGNYKIQPVYSALWPNDDVVQVNFNDKWGFIGLDGEVKLPIKYDQYLYGASGSTFYPLKNQEGWLVYNADFYPVNKEPFQEVYVINNDKNIYAIKKDGNYFIFHVNDQKYIPIKAESIIIDRYNSNENYFIVKNEGQYHILNINGEITGSIPKNIESVKPMVNSKTIVEIDDKHGYIDHKSNLITPIKYQRDPGDFENGFASVSLNNKFGFINEKGEEVIPMEYEEVRAFNQYGHAVVEKKNIITNQSRYGVINRKNNWVVKPEYYNITEPGGYTSESELKVPKEYYTLHRPMGYMHYNGTKYFKNISAEEPITEESVVAAIRGKFYPTNANSDDYEKYELELNDTTFIGLYEKGKIRKIIQKDNGSITEYYYHEELDDYNRPYFIYIVESNNSSKKEHRYYFYKGNLIRYINPKGIKVKADSLQQTGLELRRSINNSYATVNNYMFTIQNPKLKSEIARIDSIVSLYNRQKENWDKKTEGCEDCEGGFDKNTYYVNKGDTLITNIEGASDHQYSNNFNYYKEGKTFYRSEYYSAWGFTGHTAEGHSKTSDHYNESKTYYLNDKTVSMSRSISNDNLKAYKFVWRLYR